MNKGIIIAAFISGLISVFIPETFSQAIPDQELFTLFERAPLNTDDYVQPLKDSENEMDMTLSFLFLFYKTFFSSQDIPVCIFTPSCSEYAVEAFQKKGIITGWLSTFDRLSRCHGLVNPDHYHFDMDKKRFNDPVE